MDVQMPHCDGYKATKLIRKHKDATIRNILIIAMTASAIEGDREKCLASGMNNYLAKPVKPNTLKALLESYLQKEHDRSDAQLHKDVNTMVRGAVTNAEETEVSRKAEDRGREERKAANDKIEDGKTEERRVELEKAEDDRSDDSRPHLIRMSSTTLKMVDSRSSSPEQPQSPKDE